MGIARNFFFNVLKFFSISAVHWNVLAHLIPFMALVSLEYPRMKVL